MQTHMYVENWSIILPEKTIRNESQMTEKVNMAKLIRRASLKFAGRDRARNAIPAQMIAKIQLYNSTAVWRSLADEPQSTTAASPTIVLIFIGRRSRNTTIRIISNTNITITIKNWVLTVTKGLSLRFATTLLKICMSRNVLVRTNELARVIKRPNAIGWTWQSARLGRPM